MPQRTPASACGVQTQRYMQDAKRIAYVTRHAILMLLSDDEVSAVSAAETATKLAKGDHYIDLEQLSAGVRTADADAPAMKNILPAKAVRRATWARIVKRLRATQPPATHLSEAAGE